MSEATSNCKKCVELFYSLSTYSEYRSNRGYLTKAAAQGCEVCTILREAIRQLAEISREEQPAGSAWYRILEEDFFVSEYGTLKIATKLELGVIEFELYYQHDLGGVLADDHLSRIFRPRQHRLQSSTSGECFQLLKKWYQDCKTSHPECSQELSKLPTRVIMIQDGSTGPQLKLVESSGLKAEYVALSYRWFTQSDFKLTAANHLAYQKKIPHSSLPAIFHDAVTVCNSLNIQYLWIDSLCIFQDSIQDWDLESSRMQDVYRNASLVIGASVPESTTIETGFLGPRLKHLIHDVGTLTLPQKSEPLSVYVRPYFQHLRVATEDNPLAYRGWTYQEASLARRYLLFKPDEMEWQCEVLSQCECGIPTVFTDKHDFSLHGMLENASNREIYDSWMGKVVYVYSDRKLTFESDKLPALSGVAMFFQSKLQDDYLAGIWKGDLLRGLCWRVFSNEPARQLPVVYRAPSWSWISTNAHILFPNGILIEEYVELVDANCETSNGFPFGRVLGGYITLKAPVVEAWIRFPSSGVIQEQTYDCIVDSPSNTGNRLVDAPSSTNNHWLFHLDAGLSAATDIATPAVNSGDSVKRVNFQESTEKFNEWLDPSTRVKVYCMLIGIQENLGKYKSVMGLVLGRSKENRDHFHRLGLIFQPTGNRKQPFEGNSMMTVTIV